MTKPLKWEPRDSRAGDWQARLGKLRLREWNPYDGWRMRPTGRRWRLFEWSIEGHECRPLASGGAPTRKAARAMAEVAARAAIKAGLR